MLVSVYAHGKWRRATPNQYRAFTQRVPNRAITTGRWTVEGTDGNWQIYSNTERYRIKQDDRSQNQKRHRHGAASAEKGSRGHFRDFSSYGPSHFSPRQTNFSDDSNAMGADRAKAQPGFDEGDAWSREKTAAFFDLYRRQFPQMKINDYQQAVTTYVTTPSIARSDTFDFDKVAIFGEIAFADSGLTTGGFWVGPDRFANSNGPNYKTMRGKAMTLFNEAYRALTLP